MDAHPSILIVDDREENLIALQALLEDSGAEILKATSGNEALSLMLKQDIALVLLDVQMPGMDGFEVAELMRGNVQTREIPIIFVTAINKDQQYIFKGYEAGAVDYLSKPIEPLILKGKVAVFLKLWRQRKALHNALAEKEKLAEKLRVMAEYDPLTGLPNRALFMDRLAQAMNFVQRNKNVGTLMFIDLDKFKEVNDTLGHDYGDKLLIQAAERLTACVRKSDTVARLGGDEFTVILQDSKDEACARVVAEKILEQLARPFQIEGHQLQIGGSIGVTVFPDDATDITELLKNADTAMYEAKNSGRNTIRYHALETIKG